MLSRSEDVEVHALSKRGWSISAIARHLGCDRKTVRSYLNGEREPGVRRSSAPDPWHGRRRTSCGRSTAPGTCGTPSATRWPRGSGPRPISSSMRCGSSWRCQRTRPEGCPCKPGGQPASSWLRRTRVARRKQPLDSQAANDRPVNGAERNLRDHYPPQIRSSRRNISVAWGDRGRGLWPCVSAYSLSTPTRSWPAYSRCEMGTGGSMAVLCRLHRGDKLFWLSSRHGSQSP